MTIYECAIVYGGETKTVKANWAGVVTSVYDQIIDEEDARRVSILLGPIQAEMFFEQAVNVELRDPRDKFRIKISKSEN